MPMVAGRCYCMVVGGYCCGSGGCAVVVDGDNREEIIY